MTMRVRLQHIGETLLELVFPSRCVGCGAEGAFFCHACLDLLHRLDPPLCARCGLPCGGGTVCGRCAASPPEIDGIRSLFWHEGPAREAVHWLKYRNVRALARPLAEFMSSYIEAEPLPVDVLVPVPLHPQRVRRRGYNQSTVLARELARLTGLPLSEGGLVRSRNTAPQVTLGAEARRQNMRGAFRCQGNPVADRRVLLIDDVCTTGATVDACAVALKEAGAASVWALTLSREL